MLANSREELVEV
ncbi:13E12 repeat family protein, partial [Mycobacterium tuberculosis M1928]